MTALIRACFVLLLLMPLAAAHRSSLDADLSLRVEGNLSVHASATAKRDADLRFEWDWGDGETSVGASARHVFAHPGRYEVVVTITDERTGECRTERRSLVVEAEASPEADVDAEEQAEAEAETEADARKERRRASAGASVSAHADVRLDAQTRWGSGRSDARSGGDDEGTRGSFGGHARLSSYDRHETPSAGLALGLSTLAGLALALRRP